VPAGVRVAVRLTPRSHADRIEGVRRDAGGAPALAVSVAAPPVENQANDALLRLLGREWRLARRDLTLAGGHKSRDKIIAIAGEPVVLMNRLAAALSVLLE
jgi:hypothetical protein